MKLPLSHYPAEHEVRDANGAIVMAGEGMLFADFDAVAPEIVRICNEHKTLQLFRLSSVDLAEQVQVLTRSHAHMREQRDQLVESLRNVKRQLSFANKYIDCESELDMVEAALAAAGAA